MVYLPTLYTLFSCKLTIHGVKQTSPIEYLGMVWLRLVVSCNTTGPGSSLEKSPSWEFAESRKPDMSPSGLRVDKDDCWLKSQHSCEVYFGNTTRTIPGQRLSRNLFRPPTGGYSLWFQPAKKMQNTSTTRGIFSLKCEGWTYIPTGICQNPLSIRKYVSPNIWTACEVYIQQDTVCPWYLVNGLEISLSKKIVSKSSGQFYSHEMPARKMHSSV